MEITTEIEIRASAQRIWSLLVDFSAYPEWNPFVRAIHGDFERGDKITVRVRPVGGKEMTFRPTILKVVPGRELRWLGHLWVPGLFDGEHYFLIESKTSDRVRFIHGEQFSGLLLQPLKSRLEDGTRAGFEAMNEALKSRAENEPEV